MNPNPPTPHVEPFRPMAEAEGGTLYPRVALYSVRQILLASLLGGPPGAALLLFLNYKRRGLAARAWLTLASSLPVTAILVALGFLLPERVGDAALPVATLALVGAIAQQDEAFHRGNLAAGAPKASSWAAAGIGLSSLALVFAVGVGGYVAFESHHTVDFGYGQTVTYENGATEADARKAGDVLKSSGYFSDSTAASVHISRRAAAYVLDFAVQDGAWEKAEQVSTFAFLGRFIGAEAFPGSPLVIRICDDEMSPKETLDVPARGRASFGGDQDIIYDSTVTRADADKLGAYLKEIEFFGEGKKPKDVGLRRDDLRFVVTFIVGDGQWTQPTLVKGFEGIREGIASNVFGGQPVVAELANARWEAKKTLTAPAP